MGRGHYSGGSTIIRLSEAGTRFSTSDIHEEPRRRRGADEEAVDANEARKSLLFALTDENFRQRGKRPFPNRTPGWLIEEVHEAGGPDAWAVGQPEHAKARALGARERGGRGQVDPAPSQPQYILIPASDLRNSRKRWRNGPKPSQDATRAAGPSPKGGRSPKPPQRPTSRALAGLAPSEVASLRRKGWTISGKWLLPPTTPKPRSPAQPKKRRTLQSVVPDTGTAASITPRSLLPQSSVLQTDTPPKTDEEWRRDINWSSATDGGFW